ADLALVDVRVVDVAAGELRPPAPVLVREGRIVAVAPAGEIDARRASRVVAGEGRYLVPGLWDLHVHTLWDDALADTFLPLFVAHGVTGVRDMGGLPRLASAWPAQIESGELLGPRIVAAGPILDGQPPIHPEVSVAVADAAEARAAVRGIDRQGFAFVKVYTMLSREAYFAAADEATRLGLSFAGHSSGRVSPEEAARAGQRSIEHLANGQPEPARIDPRCGEAGGCGELLEVFAAHSTWQVPTLVLLRGKAFPEDPAHADESRLRYLPPVAREELQAARRRRIEGAPPARQASAREEWPLYLDLVARMADAGVPLGAGTDTGVLFGVPGFSLHDELELLVQAGLTPGQALRAATVGAAALLGLDGETGAVEEGRAADLVLLDENPLERIGATRAIAGVVRAGRYLDREALDRLLEGVEGAAASG
ncbi:MAG: amidohydrolase family protein, partial [Thermoanaerobaculia bacterium]|nr:amidohydrolase family protein [Thermoanaerobaculia bacterium]